MIPNFPLFKTHWKGLTGLESFFRRGPFSVLLLRQEILHRWLMKNDLTKTQPSLWGESLIMGIGRQMFFKSRTWSRVVIFWFGFFDLKPPTFGLWMCTPRKSEFSKQVLFYSKKSLSKLNHKTNMTMKHHFSYHFTRCVGYFFVIFCNYPAKICGDHGKAARCLTGFIQKVAHLTWALWNWLISHPRDAINTKKNVQASSMCAPASRCSWRSVSRQPQERTDCWVKSRA